MLGIIAVVATGCAAAPSDEGSSATDSAASTGADATLEQKFRASPDYRTFVASHELCNTPEISSLPIAEMNGNRGGRRVVLLQAACDKERSFFAVGAVDWLDDEPDELHVFDAAALNQIIQDGVDTEPTAKNSDMNAPKHFVDTADPSAMVISRLEQSPAYAAFKADSGDCSVTPQVVPVSNTAGSGGGQEVYLSIAIRTCTGSHPDDYLVAVGKRVWDDGGSNVAATMQTTLNAKMHELAGQ